MSKRKTLIVILVLLGYTALVWIGCWLLLRENPWTSAFLLTACGVTIAIVYWLVSRIGAAATVGAPAAPANVAAESMQSDPDFLAVKGLLTEANEKLSKSTLMASEKVRPTLADLPLYIIAGAEGAGKTTTFLQSGLAPEALAGQVYRGSTILPTQVANFWFARGSLVAEVSGRFFSTESGRWTRFVTALRGQVSSSFVGKLWSGSTLPNNLRGIILFVDANHFVGIPDSTRLTAMARTVQERLAIASSIFACDIPVWVVFAKADSIRFFRDYFYRLRDQEDQQPLGCTLDMLSASGRPAAELYAEAETQRIGEAFNILYRSLTHHRLTFLARESDPTKKAGEYEFPRELKRARGAIVQFLVDAFRPNPLQPGPLLRGFYFTGIRPVASRGAAEGMQFEEASLAVSSDATNLLNAEQAKAAMERVAREMAGGPRAKEQTVDRWCFASRLFHEVIQSGSGQVRQYGDRRFDVFRRVAFGVALAICGLLALGVLYSTWNNWSFVSRMENTAADLVQLSGDRELTPAHLTAMDNLRQVIEEAREYEHSVPLSMGFLLYRGNTVANSAHNVYFQDFNKYLRDPAAKSLASELAALPSTRNDTYPYQRAYERLTSYLNITRECLPPQQTLGQVLTNIWREGHPAANADPEKLRAQFEFYAAELARKRVDGLEKQPEPINRGRGYLRNFGQEDRVYRGMVDEVNQSLNPVNLKDYAQNYADVLSGIATVPGAFSTAGWEEMRARIEKVGPESFGNICVLGTSAKDLASSLVNPDALRNKLRVLYADDYVRRWKQFIADAKVIDYRDEEDAAAKLNILSDGRSPLIGLLFMVHDNAGASWAAAADPASKIVGAAKSALGRAADQNRVGRVVKSLDLVSKDTEVTPQDPKVALQPVEKVFDPGASKGNWNGPSNVKYTDALHTLGRALKDRGQSPDDPGLNSGAKKAADDGFDRVREIALGFTRSAIDDDVKRLLTEPIEKAKGLYVSDMGKATTAKLNGAGQKLCAQINPMLRKYPFDSRAQTEATAEEISSIFSPQAGSLYAFYQQNLGQILGLNGKQYVKRAEAPANIKIEPQFLDAFNRLMHVSQALFADGSSDPSTQYRLTIQPNPDVKTITLAIDGQSTTAGPQTFVWKGRGEHSLKLDFGSSGSPDRIALYDGPWGIFTMIAEADPRAPGSRDVVISRKRLGPRSQPTPIVFEGKTTNVRLHIDDFPGGVESAFDKGFFECKCVAKVAQ